MVDVSVSHRLLPNGYGNTAILGRLLPSNPSIMVLRHSISLLFIHADSIVMGSPILLIGINIPRVHYSTVSKYSFLYTIIKTFSSLTDKGWMTFSSPYRSVPFGCFPLGDTIIALFKKSKKPRKIHIFCGWGRGKNHKGKPQFLLSIWVVFLDTDCKMNASDLSQLRPSLSNPHTHTPKTNYYINISTFPHPNPTSKSLTTS